MNLPVMLDLAHREIPDVQSVVVRQGESGALTLKIAIVENKKPVDLTGYEAYLKAARPDGAVISQPCTIEQPTKGGVSYTLPPEIAGVVGKISLAHVELRKGDTLIATTDDLSILVRPRVDMDAAEAKSVVSEIDALKELLHGIIDDGSAQLASQSSEFTALKSESQAAAANADESASGALSAAQTANTAASNANTAASNADESASGALSAAQTANTAASNANTATTAANDAATKADASTEASATQTAACAAATTAAMDVATTALSKRRADTLYANALIGSAQGDMVHVEDAWSADAIGLIISGKSVQDGTPTTDAPVEVDVVDSPVSVQATGNNLGGLGTETLTNRGVTFTGLDDGGVKVVGTPSAAWANAYVKTYAPPKDTVVSVYCKGSIGISNSSIGSIYSQVSFYDKDGAELSFATTSGAAITLLTSYTNASAIVPEKAATIAFGVSCGRDTTANRDAIVYPYVVIGPKAGTYDFEPYTSNNQTITLPTNHNYLASLPDGTRDELVLRSDGVAVLTERVGKVVFDGSADEGWALIAVNQYNIANFGIQIPGSQIGAAGTVICDRLPRQTTIAAATSTEGFFTNASSEIYIRVLSTRASTLAELRTWLAANPVTVYYMLETPATSYSADNGTTWSTTDPAAGQSAIPLYKGTNNIWCTDALSPTVDLDYVQDTNKVINELRAAIVASGATN